MAAKYWIKLYHEILEDPKMGRLPDDLWRRTIELFLLAGEMDNEGKLPAVEDMAWRLRQSAEVLEADLIRLESVGILTKNEDGSWIVTNFAKRQAPTETIDRVRQFRERQRKQNPPKVNSNEKVMGIDNVGYANVTKSYIDTDTDTDTESNGVGKKPIVTEDKTKEGPRWQLRNEFVKESGIPWPDNKSDSDYWWSRIGALYEVAQKDVDIGKRLIRDSVTKLRQEELTISDPGSLVKIARALMAKPKQRITAL